MLARNRRLGPARTRSAQWEFWCHHSCSGHSGLPSPPPQGPGRPLLLTCRSPEVRRRAGSEPARTWCSCPGSLWRRGLGHPLPVEAKVGHWPGTASPTFLLAGKVGWNLSWSRNPTEPRPAAPGHLPGSPCSLAGPRGPGPRAHSGEAGAMAWTAQQGVWWDSGLWETSASSLPGDSRPPQHPNPQCGRSAHQGYPQQKSQAWETLQGGCTPGNCTFVGSCITCADKTLAGGCGFSKPHAGVLQSMGLQSRTQLCEWTTASWISPHAQHHTAGSEAQVSCCSGLRGSQCWAKKTMYIGCSPETFTKELHLLKDRHLCFLWLGMKMKMVWRWKF